MLGSLLNMDGSKLLLVFCCILKSEEAPTKHARTVVGHKEKKKKCKMSYKFEKIDKGNDSNDYWQRLYDYLKKCSELRGVDFKEELLNTFKSSYLLWLNNGGIFYLVLENDKPLGSFGFDLFHKYDLEKRQVVFSNRLIGSCFDKELIKGILERFLVYDSQSKYFYIKSEDEESDFIPLKLGVKAHDMRELYELNISGLDKENLSTKLDNYRKQYSDYSLQFYETLPDRMLKCYCDLFVELIKEVPGNPDSENYQLQESELKNQQESLLKNGIYELRYLLYDQKNKLIGLTSVGLNKKKTEIGYQHLTGISKNYRGKGFAKYLKLEMLFKLMDNYPDFKKLETEIHHENKISIQMNESMGYKQKGQRKVYLVPRERIETWLDEKEKE